MKNDPVIYRPWSPRILSRSIKEYKAGKIPVLNLDLTAKCTFCSCLYCDSKVGSPYPNELTMKEVEPLIKGLHKFYGLKWIFICGLGEPFQDPKLFKIFELAKKLDLEISFFTNGLGFKKEDVKKLKKFPVNFILKLDSFNPKTFDTILNRRGSASKIYDFLETLIKDGFLKVKNGETNLALSIVPTKLNVSEISEVLNFCKEHKIFPAIGEMELSNRALINFEKLSLSRKKLISLKKRAGQILGQKYERPLCPGIIPSIHITNVGDCVVHGKTGLSCGWFFMNEVKYEIIGNIKKNSLDFLMKNISDCRQLRKSKTISMLKKHNPVFGGGGGITKNWHKMYSNLFKNKRLVVRPSFYLLKTRH